MLGSIKVSVRDTIIYGLGNIAVKIVGLVLIPLYTNPSFFSVDQFGVLGILEITGVVLTAILASSLPQSLTRWYWDKDFIQRQKSIFFISMMTQIFVSVVLVLLLIPLSGKLSSLLFGNISWTKAITYLIIASGLQAMDNIINTLMRLQSKAFLYISTNILKLVVVLILTIYFILGRKMGLEGIYLAQVFGNLFFLIILFVYSLNNMEFSFSWNIFREMNRYGYPLLLANISAAILPVIGRYSLNSMTILKYVALFTLAEKINSVLKLVIVDSIKLSVSPMMIKKIDDPDNKRFYSKILLYTSYVLMAGIIFISLFSLEIIKIISGTKQLWQAVTLIPILSMSVFFVNLKEITVYGLHIVKKTKIIGLVVFLTTLITIGLNILFIPLWDAEGCALATFLSQFIYWGIVYYYSQKNFYIPYENGKLITLFLLGGLISFSPLLVNIMPVVPRIAIKTALFVSFPFILALFRFYDKQELLAIHGFVRKWGNVRNIGSNLRSLKNIKEEYSGTESEV